MGEQFVYRLDNEVTVEVLRSVRARVGESFEGFVDFNPEESRSAFLGPLKVLPNLEAFRGIELLEVTTTGELSTKKDPWPRFEDVIKRGGELAAIGAVEILCGFEERSSKQTRHGYDLVIVSNRSGRLFFCYSANGSNVTTDQTYTRAFMEAMIKTIDLPLRLQSKNDHFILTHTGDGELKILSSLVGGLAPSSFWCELPRVSPESGIEKMKLFLQAFATQKRFAYRWVVRRDHGGSTAKQPDLSTRIYALLGSAALPADSYELDLEFRIEELEGLDVARGLLGPKDTMFSRLCSFDLPDKNYGEFTVITSSKGHRLELTLRLPDGLSLVEEKIGLRFHDA